MAELDELEQAEVTEDRFIVDTPEKADWALYKLRETNETINQNKKLADKNHERIDEWLEHENSKANESKVENRVSLLNVVANPDSEI